MLTIKDKSGNVVCEALNITETYNAIGSFIGDRKTMLSINIESDTDKGVTLTAVVEAFTNADLSEMTIVNTDGEVVETYKEYTQLMTVTKSIQNGGMTIDVSLCNKIDMTE